MTCPSRRPPVEFPPSFKIWATVLAGVAVALVVWVST